MFDLLVDKCAEWPLLPLHLSLLRTQASKSQVRQIDERLTQKAGSLFSTDDRKVLLNVWECCTEEPSYKTTSICGFGDLKEHLAPHIIEKEKDPIIRYVFLSAANSRRPLDCTQEAFLYLCTYHQVSPEFIELLFSFGNPTKGQVDINRPRCYQEYWPNGSDDHYATPELGRSGWETRSCCKLSAMEISNYDGKWSMRETAFYHSFDLKNGRTMLLLVKSNDRIQKEIVSSFSYTQSMDLAGSFRVSMKTLLVIFNWCSEGWVLHLDVIERLVRENLRKMTAFPSPASEKIYSMELKKTLSMSASEGNSQDGLQQHEHVDAPSSTLGNKRHFVPRAAFSDRTNDARSPIDGFGLKEAPQFPIKPNAITDENCNALMGQTMERIKILEEFPFKILQSLTFESTRLKEAKIVISMNERILTEQREHYSSLFESTEFPSEIKKQCSLEFQMFQRRIKCLEGILRCECLRIDTLIQLVEDGKAMVCYPRPRRPLLRGQLCLDWVQYESILQFLNNEINKHIAIEGHGSTTRMERSSINVETMTSSMHRIARQTEMHTASMHIITFFTLFFLPGMFLGSLFSTPMFGSNTSDTETGWKFDDTFFMLFLEICLPSMTGIMILWRVYMMWITSRGTQRQHQDRVHQQC